MTTSHSSPSPAGAGVAERAGRLGRGAVGEAAGDLEPDPLLDLRRRPRSRGSRRPSPSAAGRGGGRGGSAPSGAGSPPRPRWSRRLKRQGKGSHSKARRPSRIRDRTRGESEAEELGDRARRRRRRARPRAARRCPGAIAAQIALRVRCSAAESPGGRCQPGSSGRPIRPISDQSQSADSARKPSTRKLSR